ncbi:DNA methyltransferase [Promethearchaeum syntrophicum]|uniref:Type II methyltransferase n=1 Tax=Promethearchaeum syntrophicum TaxID=2594042 RepID=A0A5B9DEF4_9ARCH|nr:DNA methyltransferase [Candidatus Prometheoarchaeum syntrophicum]QEE17628.1 Modification methylase MjaI [Candidatus Prometheoarchaeum syntrophicum]
MLLLGEELNQRKKPSEKQKKVVSPFIPQFSIPKEPEESCDIEGRGKYSSRNTLNNLTGTEWIKFTRSWFEHHPPPRNKKQNEHLHPAKFPEDLIANFINFFTKEGMWVLDPFVGTGSTLVACDQTKRNGIGVELTKKWADIAANRTDQYVILGDCRDLKGYNLPLLDFSISSPPYWDMLSHSRGGSNSTQKDRIKAGFDASFSDNDLDLANIVGYKDFMEELLQIYKNIFDLLRPGKYCAVIMQNTLKQKQQFHPVAWEFALKMKGFGWQICQEFIWCQRDKKLGIWGYPNTYISNVHHHYILIFRKPK